MSFLRRNKEAHRPTSSGLPVGVGIEVILEDAESASVRCWTCGGRSKRIRFFDFQGNLIQELRDVAYENKFDREAIYQMAANLAIDHWNSASSKEPSQKELFNQLYGSFSEGSEIGDAFEGLQIAARYLDDETAQKIHEIMKDIIKSDVEWRIENKDEFEDIPPAWIELLDPEWQNYYNEIKKNVQTPKKN